MTELRQRRPRVQCKAFLAYVRTKACCICGAVGRTQAAHIRYGTAEHEHTGKGVKPDDWRVTPLCGPVLGALPAVIGCHAAQDIPGERQFWEQHGKDPFVIADRLKAEWLATGAQEPQGRPARKRTRKARPIRKPPGCGPLAAQRSKKRIPSKPFGWPKGRKIKNRGFHK